MSPLVLLALPLAAAPVLLLLQHRGALAASLSALTSLLWAALCLAGPLAPTLEVLGRTMALSRLDRLALAFLGLEAALLTLIDRRSDREVVSAPAILLMLGITTAALMTTHLGIEALLLSVAAMIAVFVMAGYDDVFTTASHGQDVMAVGDHDPAQPAPGYLTLMVIAALLLVAAAWFGDVTVQADVATGARPVAILLATGVGILLAVPPFHAWWVATVRYYPTVLATFLGIMLPTAGLIVLVEYLQADSWVTAGGSLTRILMTAGLVAVAVGGCLAALAGDAQRWLAYSTIADTGCMLAGLATMTVVGATGAAFLLLNHGLSLALIAACRAVWPNPDESAPLPAPSEPQAEVGPGTSQPATDGQGERRSPLVSPVAEVPSLLTVGRRSRRVLAALGWAVGGLSLSGAPLTAGFAGRWLVYRPLFQYSPVLSLLPILSSFGLLVGHLRTWPGGAVRVGPAEVWGRSILLSLLIAALTASLLVLGVTPGPILFPIVGPLRELTFLSP